MMIISPGLEINLAFNDIKLQYCSQYIRSEVRPVDGILARSPLMKSLFKGYLRKFASIGRRVRGSIDMEIAHA